MYLCRVVKSLLNNHFFYRIMHTVEAIAHFVRGLATMFFRYESSRIFRFRNRNRVMYSLTVISMMIALVYLKDVVLLFEEMSESAYVDTLTSIIDYFVVPFVCSFFIELSMPQTKPTKALVVAEGLQMMLLVGFVIHPVRMWLHISFFFMALLTIATMIIVAINIRKYRKVIFNNLSYLENVDVLWIEIAMLFYFSNLFLHRLIFSEVTWASEAVFNILSIMMWSFLYYFSKRHRVLKVFLKGKKKRTVDSTPIAGYQQTKLSETADDMGGIKPEEECVSIFDEGSNEDEDEEADAEDSMLSEENIQIISKNLKLVMEEEKLYLQPKLTLNTVARAINTNKSYLSSYLHSVEQTTFYDFVNRYRIVEACRIMEDSEMRKTYVIVQIAHLCGFSSVSTFNRYFYKITGVLPSKYKKRYGALGQQHYM